MKATASICTLSPEKKQIKTQPEWQVRVCPICHARIGEYCVSGNRVYFGSHEARRDPRPAFQPHPEWVNWWREMRIYEGKQAIERPADLIVPTQAELLSRRQRAA